jgi:hypothetical protein
MVAAALPDWLCYIPDEYVLSDCWSATGALMSARLPNHSELSPDVLAEPVKLNELRRSRRELLRLAAGGAGALGLSALLAACGGKGGTTGKQPASPAGSIGAVGEGATQLSLINAQSQLPTGTQLFTFGLSTPDNNLVSEGKPQVWTAKDETSKALGPFPAEWRVMDAYDKTGDKSPRSPLVGFYAAEVEFPGAGNWLVAAVVEDAGRRSAGRGAVPVADKVVAQVGSKALATPTVVAKGTSDLSKVCTRNPPCPMHEVSLDRATRSGRPTAVSFSTPLFCSSQMCGPAVDELLVVARDVGGKANFVHVEIYPNEEKPEKPVKAFTRWGFESEPWTVVIDAKGVIRARFEGPVTAAEISGALRPLLG